MVLRSDFEGCYSAEDIESFKAEIEKRQLSEETESEEQKSSVAAIEN